MMRTRTFQARNAQEAAAQIRATLGPEAVVLQVRKVPAQGLAGLFQRPRVEVVAAVPEPDLAEETRGALELLRRELAELRALVEKPAAAAAAAAQPIYDSLDTPPEPGEWAAFFLRLGLLPPYARQLATAVRPTESSAEAPSPRETSAALRSVLQRIWRAPDPLHRDCLQVLVGAPGVGKTTALCKWLARLILRENQSARVWWADGERPNLPENLRLHAELLGVPVERWREGRFSRKGGGAAEVPPDGGISSAEANPAPARPGEVPADAPPRSHWEFLDLPGVPWQDRAAVEALRRRAQAWGPVQWHVVVSAAYDVRIILQQVQAYSVLPLSGIIVTHVDEQPALGRLWNLLCGTNCSVRYLAGGQNIPGEFSVATPAALGPAILWAETADGRASAALAGAGKPSAMQGVADWQ